MDSIQARQRQLQGSRPVSRMSTRTAYKIRGNGEATLPIEDWAKGISRAFSRRKKSFMTKPALVELSTQTIAETPDFSFSAHPYTPSTWTAASELPAEVPVCIGDSDVVSTTSTENWIREMSLDRPVLQPRNPRRASLFIESTIYQAPQAIPEHDVLTPMSSASSGSLADWHSDTNTDQSLHDFVYQNQVDEPVELPSDVCVDPASFPKRTSSLPKTYPKTEPESAETAVGTEDLSLRSIFFSGSPASRSRPRSLSIVSSHFSIRSRALSRASSMLTFTTAVEFQGENEVEIQLGNPFQEENSTKTQAESVVANTLSQQNEAIEAIEAIPAPEAEVETGIDEDCSVYEDDSIFEDVIRSYNTAAGELVEEQPSPATISEEESAFEHCRPGDGSLGDILFQVASSSPYTGSDSEDASSISNTSASDMVEVSSQSSFEEDVSRRRSSNGLELNKNSGYTHADHESILDTSSTASTYGDLRRRIPRHYKMINGTIVAFEPWRSHGQSDLSRYTLS